VTVDNLFLVSTTSPDMIYEIQKINHYWLWL
jgi:hypothetical protein